MACDAIAATPISGADVSPDVSVVLQGVLVHDDDVAIDDFSTITLSNLGTLPTSADVDAYHPTDGGDVLLSFDTSVSLPGGLLAGPEDVVRFDGVDYTLEFDGSAEGLPAGVRVDAVSMLGGGELVLSFDTSVQLGGVTFDDEDLARFDGVDFVLEFDGSFEGVDPALDLDGAHVLVENDNLVVSFDGSGTLGGVLFDDEDALEFDGATWEMAYDGSAEHPALAAADIDAVGFVPEPSIALGVWAGSLFLRELERRRRAARFPTRARASQQKRRPLTVRARRC